MYAQNSPIPPSEFTEVDAREIAIRSLQARAASTTKMLNYVAAFSFVNSVLQMIHIPFGLAFGLFTTKLIDSLSNNSIKGLLINLVPIGFYFLMAFLMKKHWGWFVVGMVFYLIDGLMAIAYLQSGNIVSFLISTAVHGYVLYVLWQGMTASRAANNLATMPSGSNR